MIQVVARQTIDDNIKVSQTTTYAVSISSFESEENDYVYTFR